MWDASLPGHSCGGSGGFEPPSLLGLVSQATRDVAEILGLHLEKRNRVIAIVVGRRSCVWQPFRNVCGQLAILLQLRTIITK